ncbi:MAG: fibronectin type III domain-containing protein [Candidatus Sumerlaeia bacterium]
MIHLVRWWSGRLIAAAMLMIAVTLNASGEAIPAPTSPDSPIPSDAAADVEIHAPLQWNTAYTTPTLARVAEPKVLIFNAHNYQQLTSFTLEACRTRFSAFTTTTTTSTDPETLARQLADKQIFLVPAQDYWTLSDMGGFGTTIGPVLRQFVKAGGLVIVQDYRPYGGTAEFLTNAGLMNVIYRGSANGVTVKVDSSNPLVGDLPTTFTMAGYGASYVSVGDAEVLVRNGMNNDPMAAVKTIGAGHVLLLGWIYYNYTDGMAHILSNAFEQWSLSAGANIMNYDVFVGTSTPPTTRVATTTFLSACPAGSLDYSTRYYWQVMAKNSTGMTPGPIWSFQTMPMPVPDVPASPKPMDGADLLVIAPSMSWDPGMVPATYAVYLDKVNPPVALAASGLSDASYTSASLENGTTYYWRVVSHNATGDTSGPVWSFRTPDAPPAASSPTPADGSTSASLTASLQWSCTTSPVKILAFNGHSDNRPINAEYVYTIAAIRNTYPNFTLTETQSEDPATLAAQLADNQVFLMPEQENWTRADMGLFGTKIAAVLQEFVANGGMLIACDSPAGYQSVFLKNAGLMNAVSAGLYGSTQSMSVVVRNHFTEGIADTFGANSYAEEYSSVGDAQVLVRNKSNNNPMVALKSFGSGLALLIGWDYEYSSTGQRLVIANAVRHVGGPRFDVYLGTTNPPATLVMEDGTSLVCPHERLQYETTYYWRVVSRNLMGTTVGPVWSFRTPDLPEPEIPANPIPYNGTVSTWTTTTTLSWEPGLVPISSMTVKFGTTNPPTTVLASGLTTATCSPGPLAKDQIYYWQVTATNKTGSVTGPVWSFSTATPLVPFSPVPADGATSVPLTTTLRWNGYAGAGNPPATQVLALWNNSNKTINTYEVNTLRNNLSNCHVTTTTVVDPTALSQLLYGKNVFWMLEQYSSFDYTAFGASVRSVLQQFMRRGGMVIVLNTGQASAFLGSAGLMDLSAASPKSSYTASVAVRNGITQGLDSFFAPQDAVYYTTVGDALPLVTFGNNPVVAYKPFGAGGVLMVGWNYRYTGTGTGTARILTNAVLYSLGYLGADRYDVYFGTTNPPTTKLIDGAVTAEISPGALDYETTYYWQVVAHNLAGDTVGPVWSFRTLPPPLPAAPSSPTPANQSKCVSTTTTLTWAAATVPATFSVRFDTKNPPEAQVATGLAQPQFTPGQLARTTTYYWQVTASNSTGSVEGPVWSFSTAGPPFAPLNPSPEDGATSVPLKHTLKWTGESVMAASSPIKLLFFDNHGDKSYSGECIGTYNALAAYGHSISTQNTENTATLEAMLADQQVFVMTEQENWTVAEMAAFGKKIGPVLRRFARAGGVIVMCDGSPTSGTTSFLASAGLMNASVHGNVTGRSLAVRATHAITKDLPATFSALDCTVSYGSVGNAQALIRETTDNRPVVAVQPIGAGSVVLLGMDFDNWNYEHYVLLNNSVRTAASVNVKNAKYDVYFGKTNPPTTKIADSTATLQVSPGTLEYGTTYYWRVVAHNSYGETAGPVWSFRTLEIPPPDVPSRPAPADTAKFVPTTTTLSWKPSAVPVTFSLKFGPSNPPTVEAASDLTQALFETGPLAPSTTYYWQVTATNKSGTKAGPVWSFTTAGPPRAPFSPSPADGATSISLDTQLSWNRAPTLASADAPIQILAFSGHSDNGLNQEYQNTVNMVTGYLRNSVATSTTTEVPATLALQLKGKQVFLMPKQEYWNAAGAAAFGTEMAPVLQQFVQGGGLVVACDYPGSNVPGLLANSGLMQVTAGSSANNVTLSIASSNAITQGITSFTSRYNTTCYESVGDAQVLIKKNSDNKPVAAWKQIGSGGVLLMGWDYYSYTVNMQMLMVNAIQYASAASSVELYDVYFGTTNPPTAKLAENTHLTQCSPGALDYDTTYYWRVVAHNHLGDTDGPVWSFRTRKMPLPGMPTDPSPADQTPSTPLAPVLTWTPGALSATFSIKLDTNNPPTKQIISGLTSAYCTCAPLSPGTTYYWQVTTTNVTGSTAGPVWSFRTQGPPNTPLNPSPTDGATSASINSVLQWTGSTIPASVFEPVRILAFTGHCNIDEGSDYQNMLAALREHFTNFELTVTTSEDPNELSALLAGKHAFLIPEQANWPQAAMTTFGTQMKATLQQYVNAGGWVICCDNTPWYGTALMLKNAGLMNMNNSVISYPNDLEVKVASVNSITQTLPRTFTVRQHLGCYTTGGDAEPLVTLNVATNPRPLAAQKSLGAGKTVLFGWDFFAYNSEMGLLLANAVRSAGTATGIVTYDVYFGTTNPPATKVLDHGLYPQYAPETLQYQTTYYWKIVAHNNMGDTAGPVWSFRTANYPKPEPPSDPKPADGDTWVNTSSTLSWNAGAYPGTYSVKFDTKSPPVKQIASGLATTSFTPAGLKAGTTYYWQVTAKNLSGSTAGPAWTFKTPSKPGTPQNPGPYDGQCLVTLKTPLSWSVLGKSVQMRAFLGHAEVSSTNNGYQASITGITRFFTQFSVAVTMEEASPTLAARLVDKHVFLLPEQTKWTTDAMGKFGANNGSVLREFVAKGGIVIVCDGGPHGGASYFLKNAGLMAASTSESNILGTTATVAVSNAITKGLVSKFQPYKTSVYSTSDAQVLVKQASTGKAIVAAKQYGKGTVLLIGWRYLEYKVNPNCDRLLANAVCQLGGPYAGIETYDVYFGTTNPPKTKLYSGIYKLPTTWPAMDLEKTYFWQVIAHNAMGDTTGPVWQFTTGYKSAVPGADWSYYE